MTFKQPGPQLMTTTLWDFPSQHYGDAAQGDNYYIGVTPSYVIWNLLMRYTKPGDKVLDPMAGSGTTLDVCRDLKRTPLCFDLTPGHRDVREADARNLPLEDSSVHFVFMDPPYSNHIHYSDKGACIGNLDAREGGYYEEMGKVFAQMDRLLVEGGYLALYLSDSFAKGKPFCPLGFELFLRLCQWFDPVDIITVVRHNKTMKRNHFHTAAIEGNYFLRGFNYLFIMRKPPRASATSNRYNHERAGWLSPLFAAARGLGRGSLITPEEFSRLLVDDPGQLESGLSKKKQKKLRDRPRKPPTDKTGQNNAASPKGKSSHPPHKERRGPKNKPS